jgi:hypothetical protein
LTPNRQALPNCHADSTFGVELAYADTVVSASVISVQAALLYTTSSGERRIRVHTIAAPVTTVFGNLFLSADVDAVCNMQAKVGGFVPSVFPECRLISSLMIQIHTDPYRCIQIHIDPLQIHIDPLQIHIDPLKIHTDPLQIHYRSI